MTQRRNYTVDRLFYDTAHNMFFVFFKIYQAKPKEKGLQVLFTVTVHFSIYQCPATVENSLMYYLNWTS